MINFIKYLRWRNIIKRSLLFDAKYYLFKYPDVRKADVDPITHYIKTGAQECRNPSSTFDTEFYLNQYNDVGKSKTNPLFHYITKGEAEGRAINKDDLAYKIIKESGLFDEEYYLLNYQDVSESNIDPIKHYISSGVSEGRNPTEEFNTLFYLEQYDDVAKLDINPFLHYILYGKQEKRITTYSHIGITNEDLENETSLHQHVFQYLKTSIKGMESLKFEDLINAIQQLDTKTLKIPGIFDGKLYLELYKELEDAGNLLLHFLNHGAQEGRIAYISEEKYRLKGGVKFFPEKKTIVFVSHESSATGAPLLGYSIVNELNKKYNIIHIVLDKKQNAIHQLFIKNSYMIIENIKDNPSVYSKYLIKKQMDNLDIACVICNSVSCLSVLEVAYKLSLPTLMLIHEFSDYAKPVGTMRQVVEYADNVVVPANIIKESMYEDILATTVKHLQPMPSNIHILPQGKLPFIPDSHGNNDSVEQLKRKLGMDNDTEYKLIVGSGWVQIRKGVDLFVATAKKIKKYYKGKCKFVWVGEGYDPLNDFAFGIWLQRELKYSGLENDFIFLDHQKNLDNIFMLADLFCLTSRMDPFPNVVIDALSHDLPIACFEHTTGASEFLITNNADCIIAEHLDVDELAHGIVKLLTREIKPNGLNKQLVKSKLNFTKYVENLEQLMNKSMNFYELTIKKTKSLLESGEFDVEYYGKHQTEFDTCYHYVGNTMKTLYDFSPKPGFSQAKWINDNHKLQRDKDANIDDLIQKKDTHRVQMLLDNDEVNEEINFKYAVHLHLYYVDLADEFISYFKSLPGSYDLFISAIDQDESLIQEAFKECGAEVILVKNVKNIGRDIGPMLFDFDKEILDGDYTVIGHFHSKKSFDLNDDSGNRWRNFLLKTLIGNSNTSKQILSVFNNEKIGLIFPDDRHLIDRGENKQYIDRLCTMLDLPPIEETPILPIGNMFWARTEAVKTLFSLDKNVILQEEPLPYDGSFMHALERITPHLIETNNYEYITVYRKGNMW